jgi:hypothetical protein
MEFWNYVKTEFLWVNEELRFLIIYKCIEGKVVYSSFRGLTYTLTFEWNTLVKSTTLKHLKHVKNQ